jgi:hypothetical protein
LTSRYHYELIQHHFPQAWLLLISVLSFGIYVLWDLHVFSLVLTLDRSYMALLIMALVIVATAHCGWHITHFSIHISQLQTWLSSPMTQAQPNHAFLSDFLKDLECTRPTSPLHQADDGIVDVHAERIRSPADLGWFFVDLAVRLGLLGTIIGFILIFASLTEINIQGGDELKDLLIAMSGGMGTALLTTLTGLVAASVLSFQYLILGRETEHLVGLLLRVKQAHFNQ